MQRHSFFRAVLLKLWSVYQYQFASDWLPGHGMITGMTISMELKQNLHCML